MSHTLDLTKLFTRGYLNLAEVLRLIGATQTSPEIENFGTKITTWRFTLPQVEALLHDRIKHAPQTKHRAYATLGLSALQTLKARYKAREHHIATHMHNQAGVH